MTHLSPFFRGNVHCGRSSYFHPVPPQKKFLHKLFHKPLPGQHVTLHLSLSALLSSLLVYDGAELNKWLQFYPHIIDLMAQFSILWNLNLTMRSSSFQLIVFLVKKKSEPPLVTCPTQPTCFLFYLDLCICQLSRRWQPSLALSKKSLSSCFQKEFIHERF